jgi:hypothetical protein
MALHVQSWSRTGFGLVLVEVRMEMPLLDLGVTGLDDGLSRGQRGQGRAQHLQGQHGFSS